MAFEKANIGGKSASGYLRFVKVRKSTTASPQSLIIHDLRVRPRRQNRMQRYSNTEIGGLLAFVGSSSVPLAQVESNGVVNREVDVEIIAAQALLPAVVHPIVMPDLRAVRTLLPWNAVVHARYICREHGSPSTVKLLPWQTHHGAGPWRGRLTSVVSVHAGVIEPDQSTIVHMRVRDLIAAL